MFLPSLVPGVDRIRCIGFLETSCRNYVDQMVPFRVARHAYFEEIRCRFLPGRLRRGLLGNANQLKLPYLKNSLELVLKTRRAIPEDKHRLLRNKCHWIYLIYFSENEKPHRLR